MDKRRLPSICFLAIAAFLPAAWASGQNTGGSLSPSLGSSLGSDPDASLSGITAGNSVSSLANVVTGGSGSAAFDATGATLAGSAMSPVLATTGATTSGTSSGTSSATSSITSQGGGHGSSAKSAGSLFGASSAFGVSSSGWGASVSLSASGFQPSFSTPEGFSGMAGGPGAQAAGAGGGSAKGKGAMGKGGPSSGSHSALSASSLLSGGLSGSHQPGVLSSAAERSQQEMQDEQNSGAQNGMKTSSGAAGGSSNPGGFPDSTKGTAPVSPTDNPEETRLKFQPETNYEFPDLSNREFLQPTLDVTGADSGKSTQDLFKRIEERLAAYTKSDQLSLKQAQHLKNTLKSTYGMTGLEMDSLHQEGSALQSGGLGLLP